MIEFWWIEVNGFLYGPFGGTREEIFELADLAGATSAVRCYGMPYSWMQA